MHLNIHATKASLSSSSSTQKWQNPTDKPVSREKKTQPKNLDFIIIFCSFFLSFAIYIVLLWLLACFFFLLSLIFKIIVCVVMLKRQLSTGKLLGKLNGISKIVWRWRQRWKTTTTAIHTHHSTPHHTTPIDYQQLRTHWPRALIAKKTGRKPNQTSNKLITVAAMKEITLEIHTNWTKCLWEGKNRTVQKSAPLDWTVSSVSARACLHIMI